MTIENVQKRRAQILRQLAEKARWRHDIKIPLSEVAPSLDFCSFAGGTKFVDKTNVTYEGGSDLAYDFNSLNEEGLIEKDHLNFEQDGYGDLIRKNPAVKVTAQGLEAVAESNKSWLRKAIDKQPITFLQIVITILFGICTWAIGRYLTPVGKDLPQTPIPKQDKDKTPSNDRDSRQE
jgi:hypothetical protein